MKVILPICTWSVYCLLLLSACKSTDDWEYIYVKDGDIWLASQAGQKRSVISQNSGVSKITIHREDRRIYYSRQQEEELHIYYKKVR